MSWGLPFQRDSYFGALPYPPHPYLESWGDTAQSCTAGNVLSPSLILRIAREGSGLKRHRVGSDFYESLPGLSEVPWLMGTSGVPYFVLPFKSPGPGAGWTPVAGWLF